MSCGDSETEDHFNSKKERKPEFETTTCQVSEEM